MHARIPCSLVLACLMVRRDPRLSAQLADVIDAGGPDPSCADRCALVCLAGAGEIREEVRAACHQESFEPPVQRPEQPLASMEPFPLRPCPQIGVPLLARTRPFVAVAMEPARRLGRSEALEAPARGRFVEGLPFPLH